MTSQQTWYLIIKSALCRAVQLQNSFLKFCVCMV